MCCHGETERNCLGIDISKCVCREHITKITV